MANKPKPSKVFISYSHKDKKWLDELSPHLHALADQSPIGIWDDTAIESGAQWRTQVDSALHSAKVAVLLISKDFLTSEFIMYSELPFIIQAAETNGLVI